MVYVQVRIYPSVFGFIKHAMGHQQSSGNPNTRVAIGLPNWVKIASVRLADGLQPVAPLRNLGLYEFTACVLGMGHRLHMFWVHARTVAAEMVQLHARWDCPATFFIQKPMKHDEFAASTKTNISVRPAAFHEPTSGLRVDAIMRRALRMARIKETAGPTFHIPVLCKCRQWRQFAASTLAQSIILVSAAAAYSLVMILYKRPVATLNGAVFAALLGFVRYCRALAAATKAKAARIWSFRIVWQPHRQKFLMMAFNQGHIHPLDQSAAGLRGNANRLSATANTTAVGIGSPWIVRGDRAMRPLIPRIAALFICKSGASARAGDGKLRFRHAFSVSMFPAGAEG